MRSVVNPCHLEDLKMKDSMRTVGVEKEEEVEDLIMVVSESGSQSPNRGGSLRVDTSGNSGV